MATKAKKAVATKKVGIAIRYCVLGADPRSIAIAKGSTVGDFRKKYGLEGITLKVDGSATTDSTELLAGQTLTAVPQTKGGR